MNWKREIHLFKSNLVRNSLATRIFNRDPRPSIWKCSYWTRWSRYFKFFSGLIPPSFMVTRKMVLTYWPGVSDTSIMDLLRTMSCNFVSTRVFISGLKVGWKGGTSWQGFDIHSNWQASFTTLKTQGSWVMNFQLSRQKDTRPSTPSWAWQSSKLRLTNSGGVVIDRNYSSRVKDTEDVSLCTELQCWTSCRTDGCGMQSGLSSLTKVLVYIPPPPLPESFLVRSFGKGIWYPGGWGRGWTFWSGEAKVGVAERFCSCFCSK